jgi:hypothetical protein
MRADAIGPTSSESNDHVAAAKPPPSSERVPAHPGGRLQQALGNGGFGRLVQSRLRVSEPGDACEQEADRVAGQVLRMPARAGASAGPGAAARSASGPVGGPREGGKPLSAPERAYFEPRFGVDLGGVRVHADAEAARSAQSLDALAYTVGSDVVFGEGQYAPDSPQGRRLLAHELAHVVQGDASFPGTVHRQMFRRGTNYRFDTHQVTEDDLDDPDIRERFAALDADGLRHYRNRVFDPAVTAYITRLLAVRSTTPVDRPDYLRRVQEAVRELEDAGPAAKTLSDVLLPLLKELSKASRVMWKSPGGAKTGGKPFGFKAPGKGAKKIELTLVLDEADPITEKRGGYFSSSEGHIALMVQHNPTVESIRRTLVHEALHLAVDIVEKQGAAALGSLKDEAVQALQSGLNKTVEIQNLTRIVSMLHVSLNASRAGRGGAAVPDALVGETARFLWEEILVRAETFYFELLHWPQTSVSDPPTPNYLDRDSVGGIYLKESGLLTDADLGALTTEQEELIDRISTFLLYRMRGLIKSRGVINLYVPHPLEPVYDPTN